MSEITLGGYMLQHGRAAAFGGSDGAAYSVGIYVPDAPDERGRYGAALLFIRWSPEGERPVGHLESDYLTWGGTPEEAEERLRLWSLYDVKAALEELIHRGSPEW